MGVDGMSSTIDIAVSGLRTQGLRMNTIASNIANANTSRTDTGEPYRRREVILSTIMEQLSGANVVEVAQDFTSDFKSLYEPGHPDANPEGYVLMPNVDIPLEMMHMVTASRAYQANAAVLKRYQESVNVALELLR